MPSNKKHMRNLTNQRAFRERRENYLRSLEIKVEKYEKAYAEQQNEIRLLKEEAAILKQRLSLFESYGFNSDFSITSSDDSKNLSPLSKNIYDLMINENKDTIELETFSIKEYDYSQFNAQKHIGNGGFSTVYSADFQGKTYALKSLNNNLCLDNGDNFKKISQELKSLYTVKHPNVIKFYGTSKHPEMGNFIMILQFANNGSLRDYLQSKQQNGVFKNSWYETIKIAEEITIGLKYLHDKGIIHQNLHSKNILINDGKALIADFGISNQINQINDTSISSSTIKIAYIEPQCFMQHEMFKRDERSDIYSLGVLLWELTSGTPPFSDSNDYAISIKIFLGEREKVIPGTPKEYSDLYINCWTSEPEKRPKLDGVLNDLKILSTETTGKFITNCIITDNQLLMQSASYSMQLSDKMPSNKNTNSCSVTDTINSDILLMSIEDKRVNRDVIINDNERIYMQDYSMFPINNDCSFSAQTSYPPLSNGNLPSFLQGFDKQLCSKNGAFSPTHSPTLIEPMDEIMNTLALS
ncbi:kinase-like protein [Gigaspora margarita]|nr:kinase-like protein [Gigaspora margarita]